MARRLLDVSSTGVCEYIHYDHSTGASWIETVEDETPLFDLNRREYDSWENGRRWGNGDNLDSRNRYLRLSETMLAKLMRSGIMEDQQLLMAWADTDEARPYRTRPGRLAGTGRMV